MPTRKLRRASEPKALRPPEKPGPARQWLPIAALAALAVAVYANSVGNGFIGDDEFQLLRNPLVKDIANIPRLFASGVWSFLGVTGNYYRPLPFVIYLVIYQCAGFHAWAYHLFMVLLHAANAVLLFLFVRRMARAPIAWAAAALFAVHPVHTEAVDWIASLPDLAMTAIALGGLLLFARQNGAPRRAEIAVHCALYMLALWTKETGVVLAPLYAGYGFFCLGRRAGELRRNAALYVSMAVTFGAYLAMRLAALGSFAPRRRDFFHLSPAEFIASMAVAAARYVRTLLLPFDLNYFHVFHPAHFLSFEFIVAAAVMTAAAALLVRVRTQIVAYGIFWIAVAIAPALNLTAVGQNVFTERYLYLPSAAFCWIAAWAWAKLTERNLNWPKGAGAAILLIGAAAVIARNRDWRDNFTLLRVTERQSPDSGWVHDALAAEFVNRDAFDRALEEERLAVKFDPAMALYHKKLGYILLGKDNSGAIAEFQQVDRLEPGVAANHYDLATALEAVGRAKDAAEEYKKAFELQPFYPEAKQGYERVERALR